MKRPRLRLVLVGQAPSRTGNPKTPLQGVIGRKLAELFGASDEEYLAETERLNVLYRWPGKAGKSDLFPIRRAMARAYKIRNGFSEKRVILLGRNVAAAFGLFSPGYLEWRVLFGDLFTGAIFECAVLPHPSGINRWWNDAKNRRAARAFMRKAWRTTNTKATARSRQRSRSRRRRSRSGRSSRTRATTAVIPTTR